MNAAQGDVVVTKNEAGQIVCVTRQDKEGRILSVIAESAAREQSMLAIDKYTLEGVRRYLNDVLTEGSATERVIAQTVSRMLAAPPSEDTDRAAREQNVPATDDVIRVLYERRYTGANQTGLSWSAFYAGYRACERDMLSAAPKAPQSDDKRDAERYRWLRAQDNPHFDVFESAEELDSAIDAAMKEQSKP